MEISTSGRYSQLRDRPFHRAQEKSETMIVACTVNRYFKKQWIYAGSADLWIIFIPLIIRVTGKGGGEGRTDAVVQLQTILIN